MLCISRPEMKVSQSPHLHEGNSPLTDHGVERVNGNASVLGDLMNV